VEYCCLKPMPALPERRGRSNPDGVNKGLRRGFGVQSLPTRPGRLRQSPGELRSVRAVRIGLPPCKRLQRGSKAEGMLS